MNAEQYVNAVVKKIKCSRERKKEIRKQLLTDINMRINQGENLEEILFQMGSVAEMADDFNENIPIEEQRKYFQNKVMKTIIFVAAVVAILVLLIYSLIPRSADIEKSGYFDTEQVEAAMKETIEQLDAEDYASLQKNAISQMKPVLDQETMEGVKRQIAENWGEREQFGTAYIGELIQKNKHYAVGEMTTTYENVSVTYRLTYDQDMRLAGLYVR